MSTEVRELLLKVTNQLLNLKRPDHEDTFINLGPDGKEIGYFPRDFGMEEWDWPQGVGLYGLSNGKGDPTLPNYEVFMKNWVLEQQARGLPLKNINTTAPLFTLMDLKEMEGFAIEWMDWMYHHSPRTLENGFQHVTSGDTKDELTLNDQEIWIDTLFMVVLFTAKMGVKYNRQEWKDEAAYQFLLHIKYLFNHKDSLFYHGWDFTNKHNFSEAYWCRGNSWFTLATPEFLQIMKDELSFETYHMIVNTYRSHVEKMVQLQSDNGLWHTLLDDEDSYTEVSGSAAITAGILKGVRTGLLDSSYVEVCRKAISAISQNIAEDGTVLNVSAGTAIGKRREDYKKIMIAPTAYGQALVIVLFAEVLCHQDLQNQVH